MKNYWMLSMALMFTLTGLSQTTTRCSSNDLKQLTGFWKGTLTYLDYSSGKPYTMPANLEVSQLSDANEFRFQSLYPNEPKANSADTIKIRNNGTYLNQELLISRNILANGDLEIVTQESGTDGNDQQEAIFRHTYTISAHQFSQKKEVQFKGTRAWIKRHEYSYSR